MPCKWYTKIGMLVRLKQPNKMSVLWIKVYQQRGFSADQSYILNAELQS